MSVSATECAVSEAYYERSKTGTKMAGAQWGCQRCHQEHAYEESIKSTHTQVVTIIPVMETLMQWHIGKPFRKLKRKRYINARRTLRTDCIDSTAKAWAKTLVSYGGWSKDSARVIRKGPAGPVKRLENDLRWVCKVASVAEHRTNKLHTTCGCRLHHRHCHRHCHKHLKDGAVKTIEFHGLPICANISSGMCRNCDNNTNRNILELLKQARGGEGNAAESFRP